MSDLTLLPPNSTPLEIALDQTSNRLTDIDVDVLRRIKSPADTPLAFLPYLAWERGVDLWYEDWPEWKKRRIVSEAYRLKGLKGTLAGIDAYLFFVDAKIEDWVVPPQGVVARAQSAERIAGFKARFAQLRVYPFRTRGNRPGVAAKRNGSALAVVGSAVARTNTALQHYGRKAVVYDKGNETEIRSQDQLCVDTDETSISATIFAIPGTARGNEAMVGRGAVGSLAAHGEARGRLFVLGADELTASGAAVPPGGSSVRVLNIEPETVHERHDALSYTPVAGRRPRLALARTVARLSRAGRFIYSRWYLFDARRAGADPYQALGPAVGRAIVSLSPYRAHLRVNARFEAHGRRAVVGKVSVGRAIAGKASDKIDRVGFCIVRAKALRDDIRFTTKTYRPRAIGDLSFEGEIPFGGMVPINRRSA